ncbi:hypothetical protein PV516_19660 [Streptomyces scabiei]|uniref:hypothetical protein n=1 Tax=Streptomyces scabiei TaxID=1930 RepID=UPI0029A47524|nr:hypothetical protein [Streptomyces scabiei]MDX3166008.1 hypothetical protein [Streptomyces scabiei]
MDHHLKCGQVYRACASPDDAPRFVRIVRHARAGRIRIAEAATGRREREVDVRQLHEYPTHNGSRRRTGYALEDTHEWFWRLTGRAVRGHPYTVSASAIDQDARRGGYLRLEPEVDLEAVRALVSGLETAGWTVETTTIAQDELRVRYAGTDYCPSMYLLKGEGRQYCTGLRDHADSHQDDRTLERWDDTVPQSPAWWLPGQPLPGQSMPVGV